MQNIKYNKLLNKFNIKLAKYTIVGLICTLFSMISYPLIVYCIDTNKVNSYVYASILNITISYLAQSIISFNQIPSITKFYKYIYVSIGIILIGNIIYFLILWIYSNGIIAYYISWVVTSLISYLSHYKYTFVNKYSK
jgi:putative flippase GtrA